MPFARAHLWRKYGYRMELYINSKPVAADDGTLLSDLLDRLGTPTDGIAVAVNNRVVPRGDWSATTLHEGDKITVIRAVCGG